MGQMTVQEAAESLDCSATDATDPGGVAAYQKEEVAALVLGIGDDNRRRCSSEVWQQVTELIQTKYTGSMTRI
jgi:hypothetical protein